MVTEPPKSVLARGTALLHALHSSGAATDGLTLAQLAAHTGLPKPTAHRLLGELVELGWTERTETGRYRLGLQLFVLGQSVPSRRELREAALPFLSDLYEATHENIHLAVPAGPDTLFLEKLNGRRSTPILSRSGSRLPAHCTATGKVFLAHDPTAPGGPLERLTPRTMVLPGQLARDLARTRARGYGVNLEEAEAGVSAIAAPVFAAGGRPVAAISVAGGTGRLAGLDRLGPHVRAAARALSRCLA